MRWQQYLTSEPHEKLPLSKRRALNLKFPPRTLTRLTVTLEDSLVFAGCLPSSNLKCRRENFHSELRVQLLLSPRIRVHCLFVLPRWAATQIMVASFKPLHVRVRDQASFHFQRRDLRHTFASCAIWAFSLLSSGACAMNL